MCTKLIIIIYYSDVKPANILLDERGHCHLTDFNVAGRIRRDKPMKVSQRVMINNLNYLTYTYINN
jgi:serine/threonine protein kinase